MGKRVLGKVTRERPNVHGPARAITTSARFVRVRVAVTVVQPAVCKYFGDSIVKVV